MAFEVVWAKYLTGLVGSTALAHTVVLSTFMGGLAGGAWLFGRWADTTRRPLVLYGVLEIGVAVTCLLFPLVFFVAGKTYVKIAAPFVEQPALLMVLRAGLAVATIAVPSVLMGGTLPAAARFYVRSISEVSSGVARLYFINALGAVLGCLTAGFALVTLIGLDGTLIAAALLNVIAGGVALTLSAVRPRRRGASEEGLREGFLTSSDTRSSGADADGKGNGLESDEVSPFPAWVARVALASIAAAGAASMTYEIVWIRILTLVMGGSTYAFTTMLAAFILGIAIGSAIVSWKRMGLSSVGLGGFGWLQVAVAAVTVLSIPLYSRLPYLYHRMGRLLGPEADNYPAFLGAGFLVCLLVMIVPTILLGMTFPLAARLATRSIRSLGGGVGQTYACDTAGTVVGVVLAGHFLLPAAGIQGTIIIAALTNLIAGLVCVLGNWTTEQATVTTWTRRRRAVALGLAIGVLPAWMLGGPRLERETFTAGAFRPNHSPFGSYDALAAWARLDQKTLFDRDGPDGTVTVIEREANRSLRVNGKADASDTSDLETQYLAAHLPVLLHGDARSALLVGLGAGATAAGLLAHPEIDLVTVELSRDIVDAAEFFQHVNRGAVHDPRMRLVVDDVQAWLALTNQQFDIIVSVPSNPWVAGNASLFAVEFFETIKNHLAPGGIFLQWFHDYEMTDDAVRTILRTVGASFPYAELFHAGSVRDFLLVCSLTPMEPDAERINAVIRDNPLVRQDLEHARIQTHLGVFARHILDTAAVRDVGGEGRLQRRRRPLLEYQAPKGLFIKDDVQALRRADLRRSTVTRQRVLLHRRLDLDAPLCDDEWTELLHAVGHPFLELQTGLARAWAETGSVRGNRRLAQSLMTRRMHGEALKVFEALAETGSLRPRDELWMRFATARLLMSEGSLWMEDEVEETLKSALAAALALDEIEAYVQLGKLASELNVHRIAAQAFAAAASRDSHVLPGRRVRQLLRAAEAYEAMGEIDESLAKVLQAMELDPYSLRAQVYKTRLSLAAGTAP